MTEVSSIGAPNEAPHATDALAAPPPAVAVTVETPPVEQAAPPAPEPPATPPPEPPKPAPERPKFKVLHGRRALIGGPFPQTAAFVEAEAEIAGGRKLYAAVPLEGGVLVVADLGTPAGKLIVDRIRATSTARPDDDAVFTTGDGVLHQLLGDI